MSAHVTTTPAAGVGILPACSSSLILRYSLSAACGLFQLPKNGVLSRSFPGPLRRANSGKFERGLRGCSWIVDRLNPPERGRQRVSQAVPSARPFVTRKLFGTTKTVPERWQSGRLCSTGNAVCRKRYRGFESPPLRSFDKTVFALEERGLGLKSAFSEPAPKIAPDFWHPMGGARLPPSRERSRRRPTFQRDRGDRHPQEGEFEKMGEKRRGSAGASPSRKTGPPLRGTLPVVRAA